MSEALLFSHSMQALVKFNESLAFNKNLRERIDTLRRERVVFDSIYKKLERELHEKKKVSVDARVIAYRENQGNMGNSYIIPGIEQ